uniref:Protein-serine O-palmitoleoyltransferase porcupine n=2 Tax=Photinus pyralis TaxID=7054 RepID=A0A1Y1MY89_PHOPY
MLSYLLHSQFECLGGLSPYDVWELCIQASCMDIAPKIVYMLIYNLVYQLISAYFSHKVFHLCSIVGGFAVMRLAISHSNITHFLVFLAVGYVCMYCANRVHLKKQIKTEYIAVLLCIVYLLLCEFVYPNQDDWIQSRGLFMIAAMKIISLCFDLQNGHYFPSPYVYAGYMLCPANVMFGPWISFTEYNIARVMSQRKKFTWVLRTIHILLLSFFFLSMSNCLSIIVIPSVIDNKWISAYRRAFSFRCSHYFISFLSEATMLCGGYGDSKNQYVITRPFDIELPTSLVSVVVSWNIPMHRFLKKYVYLEILRFGYFKAILGTYLISSLLHGFNLEIAAVLVTIGAYSFVQFRLQEKLARSFNACLRVRPCRTCTHKYKRSNWLIKLVLLIFACITIFDLIFLGVLMDSVGYPDAPSIYEKWGDLDFLSHWVMLGLYIITFV